jgi:hypothetical protein
MAFGAADLPALLADMGVPVVTTGAPTLGIVDKVDEEILADEGSVTSPVGRRAVVTSQMGRRITVHVMSGTVANLHRGTAITVDGVAYKVSSFQLIDDGLVTVIEVRN